MQIEVCTHVHWSVNIGVALRREMCVYIEMEMAP